MRFFISVIFVVSIFFVCSCAQTKHFSDLQNLSSSKEKYVDRSIVLDAIVNIDEHGAARACSIVDSNSCIYLTLSVEMYGSIKANGSVKAIIYGVLRDHGFVAQGDVLRMYPTRIEVTELEFYEN